ncbi:uncharacterized protein LOC125240089 [Leguminivora glycinivorella]|uniref:uncharacterized protein LOC125240089 n=1 Tax=Leguminivora glycinivorella TaxID=1035111 RepID=UPI00200E4B63|nr:uncharacterized protein LOC125240089 [Leguminivora glycinivorella]
MAMKAKILELKTALERAMHVREGLKVAEHTLSKMCLSPQERQCAITIQNEKILATITKVESIQTKLNELEAQMKADLNNIKRPEFTSPKFRHPINFLEDLTDYLNGIPAEYRTVETIIDCFQGDAYSWAMIFKERWSTIEDFKKDFLEQYWGHAEQSLLRREIVCGVWDIKQETMAEHFSRLEAQAKLLTRKIADEDLIVDIMSHFSDVVRGKWYSSRQRGIPAAAAFLQRMDTELEDRWKRTEPKLRTGDNVMDLNDSDDDYDDMHDEPLMTFNGSQATSTEQREKLAKEVINMATKCSEKAKEKPEILTLLDERPAWDMVWTKIEEISKFIQNAEAQKRRNNLIIKLQ